MQQKRWNILPCNEERTASLKNALGINSAICNILIQRGINCFEDARSFFRPGLEMLHDPWLMKDMDKAVQRILSAFEKNENIMVFGDYDVDGTTAVALMYQFLCKVYLPEKIKFYIPHRYREGYGVSKMGINYASENEISLIICLDCGIKSTELIAYASTLGIDFIVCDHHNPDKVLPQGIAILNPKQPGCAYPYKELCGCGVGFKLVTALSQQLGLPVETPFAYLDLVATAIAADIVPITGENRVLAFFGLQKINNFPIPGFKALIELAGLKKHLTISNVVFVIAPRVNAAGRMDDAKKAVQLFIENDFTKALEFAEMLHSDNADRKDADVTITEEALAIIAGNEQVENRKSSVVFKEHWHKGVVGIVASRLIEHYYRPTVVLTENAGLLTGSARSVTGFNLYDAIYQCREYLVAYGGHFAAAGLSMLPENLQVFTEKFEKVVSETIADYMLVPEIIIDTETSFKDLTSSFYNIISQIEPFGPGNMRPIFICRNVFNTGYSKILKEQHIKFVLKQADKILNGIGFNMVEKFYLLEQNLPLDIVFNLDENEWNGNKSIQLKMIDLRLSQ
ncbi:MAG: single-stranded-DNA-specific exonuclease RecJ [Ferruginibacter sp.]